MNILFVIPSLAKGGQEKAGMFLCNYLMEFHTVTVVCFEKRNEADFNYQCPIVRIYKNSTFFSKFETYFFKIRNLLLSLQRTKESKKRVATRLLNSLWKYRNYF